MKLIIYGPTGSGKSTKAKEAAENNGTEPLVFTKETFIISELITSHDNPVTIIIEDAHRFKDSELTYISKNCRHDLIFTTNDLGSINTNLKKEFDKIAAGNKDFRKANMMKKYPMSDDTISHDANIFKVLREIYQNKDRHSVQQMLMDIKPNLYMLSRWMGENGDIDLLHYIDQTLLFKAKPEFIYSVI